MRRSGPLDHARARAAEPSRGDHGLGLLRESQTTKETDAAGWQTRNDSRRRFHLRKCRTDHLNGRGLMGAMPSPSPYRAGQPAEDFALSEGGWYYRVFLKDKATRRERLKLSPTRTRRPRLLAAWLEKKHQEATGQETDEQRARRLKPKTARPRRASWSPLRSEAKSITFGRLCCLVCRRSTRSTATATARFTRRQRTGTRSSCDGSCWRGAPTSVCATHASRGDDRLRVHTR